MFKNLFTIGVRAFLRHRFYSMVNVIGLATGLMTTMFIYLWVNDELSTDKFHAKGDRIFQVISNLDFGTGEILTWPITPGPLAEDLVPTLPNIEMAIRTMGTGAQLFQHGEVSFTENGIFADSGFFDLFDFELVRGRHHLGDPSSISVSETLARKLFGTGDPIGQTVRLNDQTDFTVTAVFADIPSRSSLDFAYVLPFELYKQQRGKGFSYDNFDHPLYILVKDVSAIDETRAAMDAMMKERALADGGDGKNSLRFYLQPFGETYLTSQFEHGVPVGGRIRYVRLFTIVAIFILLMACINFMNMSTARATNRAKEVGVRKVVGAARKSLIAQFLAESVLISALSMAVALGLVYTLLPLFNDLVSKGIQLDLTDTRLLLAIAGFTLLTGLLAGSYPAFFLASYKPAAVLKGSTLALPSGTRLRKALVVFQFTLTVILIAGSIVIYQQIEYIRSKNIGYNREAVLTFGLTGNLTREFDAFRAEVLQYPFIENVSRANQSIVKVENQNSSVDWEGEPDNSNIFFRTVVTDYEFLETMGIELVEGRYFSQDFHDTASYIVTEKAVQLMGLKNPLGAKISQWGAPGTIVGVAKDFHSRSLHTAIDPIVFMCRPSWTGRVIVRFDAAETQEAVAAIERTFRKFNPEYPFNYTFLDDDFERLYSAEKVISSLALSFTFMAVIISGLGLSGLAAYMTERRRKEISIRKTLGATVGGLVRMMSTDFVRLCFIAAIIGCPVAYWLMDMFLAGYEYHTQISWDVFVLTAVTIVALSVLTIIYQVTRAAISNPVDALRNE